MSLVFIILVLVCISVYYFSYTSRIDTIKTRLVNRAKTIGRLLTQSEVFSNELIRKIDSATSFAMINKVIQAYDYKNNKIYSYSSSPGDSVKINEGILNKVRVTGDLYYTAKYKDVVAHHHQNTNSGLVIIAAGEDQEGKKKLAGLLLARIYIQHHCRHCSGANRIVLKCLLNDPNLSFRHGRACRRSRYRTNSP